MLLGEFLFYKEAHNNRSSDYQNIVSFAPFSETL